ncbi:MAG: hypothetical protein QOF66_2992 [Mycobacterium sp.]|nr:hypothetical protein [Mycobacterium sp.]
MVAIEADKREGDLRPTAAHGATVGRRSRESRFKGSQIREGAISALIATVILIGVVSNMPDSAIKAVLAPTLTPIAVGTGLDQFWGMYAPDPPSRLEDLEVHVTMADGGNRVWKLPTQYDRVVGVAVSHRWRKLKESLLSEPQIRPELAHWVVHQLTVPAERPIRVYMILRTEVLTPPGTSGRGATGVDTLYDEDLAANS